jgi:hypothetical protein
MRLLLPCSRVCWIWTEASMDLCAFWFVAAPEASTLVRSRQSTQFVRTTPVCSLGLHSLSAELLLRNRLCWVDDVWWHMGKHCGRHCTLFPWHGVASAHFWHTAQLLTEFRHVSSLKANCVDRGNLESRSVACGTDPKAKHTRNTVICP